MSESIIQVGIDGLTEWCAQQSQPPFRARQVWQWIFSRRATHFAQMTDLPLPLRGTLESRFRVMSSRVAEVRETTDSTRKLLVELADRDSVESVLMTEGNRRTVCISTQVGCAMGCVFCASGLDGVRRNLEPHEIVEQFLHARNLLGPEQHLTHAVIMGMGEPLANLRNLLGALEIVCSSDGLNLGQRRVTISTVGLPEAMRRLAHAQMGYHLAVSLHAPTDELRNRLVPTNEKTGLDAILTAADYFAERTKRQVTFEYVLLRDINDSAEHARQLARLLGERPAHVNLIPYNPVADLRYDTPRSDSSRHFAEVLRRAGLSVKIRKTKGRKIDAACGQLRLSRAPAGDPVRLEPPTALNGIPLDASPRTYP
jgi:23S rRNA (adenine2503-C2)-methyltransferase